MSDERIVDKIRKLMALAEKAGTPEEAEAAFDKAQELMVKHAIGEARLAEAGESRPDDPIVVHRVKLGNRDEIKRAKLVLYMHVAKANQCRVLDATAYFDEVQIVGHKSQAEFVDMLVSSILIQYAGERTKAWKAYQARHRGNPPQSRFKWVNGFAWGYANRIGERVQQTQRATAAKSKGGELVLRGRGDLVDQWMAENMNVRKGRALRVRGDWESQSAGREAANRADISGGRNNVRTRSSKALRE